MGSPLGRFRRVTASHVADAAIQSGCGFKACGKREIGARFDGGTIGSGGGAFLLRQTDQRLNLLPRLAECFLDGLNHMHMVAP